MGKYSLTTLSDDEEAFSQSVRTFCQRTLQPAVRSMDQAKSFDADLLKALFEHGLFAIQVPEQYGGLGQSLFQSVLAIEQLASVDPSVAVMIDVHNTLILRSLERWGSEQQQSHWFPRLASNTVGAFCLSEPSSGSDAFALKTRARQVDQGWELTGSKLWITNAKEAGLFIVFANAAPDKGHRGITAFLVPADAEGVQVGEREDKIGLRASSTCPVRFEQCTVPADSVLGEVGQGYRYAIELLNEGRIGIGAQVLGLAQGAFNEAFTYIHERQQFNRSIGSFQGVQFQVAELATKLEASRLLVYNATRKAEQGEPFTKEAAMAKLFASESAQEIVTRSLELFGGIGYSEESPIAKFYRDVKVGTIYEGTSNMQRLTIAKQLEAEYGVS